MDIKKVLYGTDEERESEIKSAKLPVTFTDVCYAGDGVGKLVKDGIYLEPVVAFKVKGIIDTKKEYGEIIYGDSSHQIEYVDKFNSIKELAERAKALRDAIQKHYKHYLDNFLKDIDVVKDPDKVNFIINEPVVASVVSVVVVPTIEVGMVFDNNNIKLYHPLFNVEISFIGRNGRNGIVNIGWYDVSSTPEMNFSITDGPYFQSDVEVAR